MCGFDCIGMGNQEGFVTLFCIHTLFNRTLINYLPNRYHVPCTILGTLNFNSSVNKIKDLSLHGAHVPGGLDEKRSINK
jgi:hypothetical protein